MRTCSFYRKQYNGSSKKLNLQLPHDSAIALWGTYTHKKIESRESTDTHINSGILSHKRQKTEATWMDKQHVIYV